MSRRNQHHYDRQYRNKRAAMLANNPHCHWCGKEATTADHYPPLAYLKEIGADPADAILLPSCAHCNYSHVADRRIRRQQPPSRQW